MSRLRFRRRFVSGETPPAPSKLTDPTLASSTPGTYQVGVQLVVTPGTYSNGSIAGYQWYTTDGVTPALIGAASGATFTPTAAEEGFSIYAVEVVSGAGGTLETQTNTVGPVEAALEPDPYGVDDAEAEIVAAFADQWAGLADNTTWDTNTTVTNATDMRTAILACFSTANGSIAITRKHKIVCNWDGLSTYSAATTNIQAKGYGSRTDGHSDNGGGIFVVAADGRTPAIANTLEILGVRGIHFKGIGFGRIYSGTGDKDGQQCVYVRSNGSFPARCIYILEDCEIGAEQLNPGTGDGNWINGIFHGAVVDYVYLKGLTGAGFENAFSVRSKLIRVEDTDLQLVKQDWLNNTTHNLGQAYYSYLLMDRVTVRNPLDTTASQAAHMDFAQTGASADTHLGYKVLIRDCLCHANHRYSGTPTDSGGSQGSYNDDYLSADNQFVIRRSTFLVSAITGFGYFSYGAVTKKSFVDRVTFMRCGVVPSGFEGDTGKVPNQDDGVGIRGSGNGAPNATSGKWLKATNCILAYDEPTGAYYESSGNVICDPKNTSLVTDPNDRPEAFFVDTNALFQRGEHVAGKLTYHLPGEDQGNSGAVSTRTRTQFVSDIWALFQPKVAYTGKGCPDLTGTIV